jgi:hypothetical protein
MSSSKRLTVRSARYSAYAFGLFVFAVGILLDLIMVELGAPSRFTLLFDDLLTGFVAGIAAWFLLRSEVRRRQQEIHRLLVLDEMNHHVRNALQVMTLYSYEIGGEKGKELTRAVQRIQWSLTEVLPKVNFDSPAPSQSDQFGYQPANKPTRNAS